jgi:hypothetical protein
MALFFWTLSIVLIPSNAGEIAKAAIDLPPSEEIAAFERSSSETLFAEMDNFRQAHAPQAGFGMGCVNVGSENGSLFDSWAQGWMDTQKYIRFIEPLWQKRAEMIWNLEQNHIDKKRAQSELAESLACISPASYLRRIFSGLAGTDYQAYADFMENARRYRGIFLDTLRSKGLFDDNVLSLFSRRTKDEITDEKFRERKRVYDEKLQRGEPWANVLNWSRWNPLPKDYVPAFRYDFAGIDFEETLWPFGILVFGAAVVFSLGFAAFLRYDVR